MSSLKFPNPHENELPHEIKLVWPPEAPTNHVIRSRIVGSLVGLAVGDALGAFAEFRSRESLLMHPIQQMQGGGTWGLPPGKWTDDTSMALCLAASLITHRGFNPYDQMVRYKWWYKYGCLSSTGRCFDIGDGTREALERFISQQKRIKIVFHMKDLAVDQMSFKKVKCAGVNVNCGKPAGLGNGALMRLAPVPLFFYRTPLVAVELSGESARLTHGSDVAIDACRYYGALIVAALNGAPKDTLLSDRFHFYHRDWFGTRKLHNDIIRVASGSFKRERGYEDGIRNSGVVVGALEAALWAFWSSNSFKEGALKIVNLGGDTDTVAAIFGQLAGAYYGYNAIPMEWRQQLYAHDLIVCMAKWLEFSEEPVQRREPSKEKHTNPSRIGRPPMVQVDASYLSRSETTLQIPVKPLDPKRRAKSATRETPPQTPLMRLFHRKAKLV